MKTFVINLKKDVSKKSRMKNLCQRAGLDFEFIQAVDGTLLKTDECFDFIQYPNSKLTPGEIGCALSHLTIYKKMINENIAIALVLEDDVVFTTEDAKEIFRTIKQVESSTEKNRIILLNEGITSIPFKTLLPNKKIGKYVKGNGTYGYVIDRDAANELLKFCLPLRFEADFWRAFFFSNRLRVYSLIPALVINADPTQEASFIEKQRKKYRNERSKMQSCLFKSECKTFRYKLWNNVLFKILKPFFVTT